jgi:hypothetical protein
MLAYALPFGASNSKKELQMVTRREFLGTTLAGVTGLCLIGLDSTAGTIEPQFTLAKGTSSRYPVLSVKGKPKHVGEGIGTHIRTSLSKILGERKAWFEGLKKHAATPEGAEFVKAMRAAAERYTAPAMTELKEISKHCGYSLDDLFILNCKNEIDAHSRTHVGTPGCSTVVLKRDDGLWVCHNEDGDKAYSGHMFVLDSNPLHGTEYVAQTYPGILAGNASWLNEHGVFMTTNYIPCAEVKPGIPRYFLYRMAIEADTPDKVIKILTHNERAYAGHHIIGSMVTRKVFSLETTPTKQSFKLLNGLYWHTNHLLHDATKDTPQFDAYIKRSSAPRLAALQDNLGNQKVDTASVSHLLSALRDHSGEPTTVCRHSDEEKSGETLGTAVFESNEQTHTLRPYEVDYYKGTPCFKKRASYPVG